jgi:hypothetical protein
VRVESAESLAMSLFTRYCAWRRTHPMSGGVRRVRRDGVKEFLALRKETFGFELAPLPRSLPLSAPEGRLNRGPAQGVGGVRVHGVLPPAEVVGRTES